jgi:radical SAM superfamily enzyme YgiQ (UPF0313 family)
MNIVFLTATESKGYVSPVLGVGYIASILEKEGHKVKIIDQLVMKYSMSKLVKVINSFKPDVVGVSAVTQYIYIAYKIFNKLKETNPNLITVLGGPHGSVLSKETLKECLSLDIVVRGEGELTFLELLEKLNALSKVRGITYRDQNTVIENPNQKLIEDLDGLPFPAYHLMPMNKYKDQYIYHKLDFSSKNKPNCGIISTTRGCPFDCIFCSSKNLLGKRIRARSPENIIEEIRYLQDRYNVKRLDVMDDTFTIDQSRILKLCELIKKEKIDISWACSTRVELFNKELALNLKKSNCYNVFFGFESGLQETLDFLCKGFTIDQSKIAVKIAKDNDLMVAGNFIIGVPGETKDKINQTINFAKKLKLSLTTFSMLTPYPGTRMYDIAKQKNWLITDDWSKYSPYLPSLKVEGLSYNQLKFIYLKTKVNFMKFN